MIKDKKYFSKIFLAIRSLWISLCDKNIVCIDENYEHWQKQSLACWRNTHRGINTPVPKWQKHVATTQGSNKRGLPKVTFLAEAEAEAEGSKKFGLRPKTEAEAEGGQ